MKLKIAILAGDGIGPEIMKQGVAVLDAIAKKCGHQFEYEEAICGAHAIDEVGDPYPDSTHEVCMRADAVLFAAVGSLKYDNNPTAKIRPETGLLAMRKKLGLFANVRPVATFDCLLHKSPLKDELLRGADFVVIRELTGGMYFGEKYQDNDKGECPGILPSVAADRQGDGAAVSRGAHRLYVYRQCLDAGAHRTDLL